MLERSSGLHCRHLFYRTLQLALISRNDADGLVMSCSWLSRYTKFRRLAPDVTG